MVDEHPCTIAFQAFAQFSWLKEFIESKRAIFSNLFFTWPFVLSPSIAAEGKAASCVGQWNPFHIQKELSRLRILIPSMRGLIAVAYAGTW